MEISTCGNVCIRKCPFTEMSSWRNVCIWKCPLTEILSGEISALRNVYLLLHGSNTNINIIGYSGDLVLEHGQTVDELSQRAENVSTTGA